MEDRLIGPLGEWRPYGAEVVVRRVVVAGLGSVLVAGCGGGPTPGARAVVDAAELPAGSPSRARSLALTPELPAAYRRVCDEQAEAAPASAAACPPLLPSGRLTVLYAGRFGGREGHRGGYSADFESPALTRIDGKRVESNGGHWRYDVAWTARVRHLAVDVGVVAPPNAAEPSSCRQRAVMRRRMRVCRVPPHEQGGGINGGHVAYVWRHRGVTYVVSVHGYGNEPRARAMVAALVARVLG
jgi:hypothetical protein